MAVCGQDAARPNAGNLSLIEGVLPIIWRRALET
jgi:hypothetical protein